MHHASLGKGKGVCVYAPTDDEQYQYICSVAKEKFQLVSMVIKKEVPIQLFVLYISKNAPLEEVVKAIEDNLIPECKVVVVGDVNYDKCKVTRLTDFLTSLGLTQIVSESTFEKSGNTLDHLYLPKAWKDSIKLQVQFNYYTDHASLSFEFM